VFTFDVLYEEFFQLLRIIGGSVNQLSAFRAHVIQPFAVIVIAPFREQASRIWVSRHALIIPPEKQPRKPVEIQTAPLPADAGGRDS
jgi:hypothetical protein